MTPGILVYHLESFLNSSPGILLNRSEMLAGYHQLIFYLTKKRSKHIRTEPKDHEIKI